MISMRITKELLFCSLFCFFILPSIFATEISQTPFNVGYTVIDFQYTGKDKRIVTLTTAIWYPTDEESTLYTYRTGYSDFVSKVAVDAPITKKKEPSPLVIFIHGGYGCGLNIAYFTEYLASQGYIVVGADYIDTLPPNFNRQIALGRIKGESGGNIMQFLPGLKVVRRFMDIMNTEPDTFIDYISKQRLEPTVFLLDKILELNRQKGSFFFQTIDEETIGVIGYSLGGISVLGLIGGHPDKGYKDKRIKAALIFSGPGYPFENNISNINIPMMEMVGDDDEPMNPEVPRKLVYARAKSPKFYLVLREATHFSFGNWSSGVDILFNARQNNPQLKSICKYGLAFFNRYLKNETQAEKELRVFDPVWAYYENEIKPNQILKWGKKPEKGEGGPGGAKNVIGGYLIQKKFFELQKAKESKDVETVKQCIKEIKSIWNTISQIQRERLEKKFPDMKRRIESLPDFK